MYLPLTVFSLHLASLTQNYVGPTAIKETLSSVLLGSDPGLFSQKKVTNFTIYLPSKNTFLKKLTTVWCISSNLHQLNTKAMFSYVLSLLLQMCVLVLGMPVWLS